MSKNSASIWKEARNAIGCPECPQDLSEPQYADLCFSDEDCYVTPWISRVDWLADVFASPIQFCHGPDAKVIIFALRVRLCRRCERDKYVFILPS